MNNTVITPKHFSTKPWSGGSTTELFIYPPSSRYSERDFDFRLSTAAVEVEESDFTPLPTISRTLMILNGEMTLMHDNHHNKALGKFEIDRFDGAWKTSSFGKCIDFNLMTRGETSGSLQGLILSQDQNSDLKIEKSWNWLFIYAFRGHVNIKLDHQDYALQHGALLILDKPKPSTLQIQSVENSELVFCTIND